MPAAAGGIVSSGERRLLDLVSERRERGDGVLDRGDAVSVGRIATGLRRPPSNAEAAGIGSELGHERAQSRGRRVGIAREWAGTASSTPALSRTVRVSTCSWVAGPVLTEPRAERGAARDGLSPTRPSNPTGRGSSRPCRCRVPGHEARGDRGADPPLEPPGSARSHGLCVAPYARARWAKRRELGRVGLPTNTKPARGSLAARQVSLGFGPPPAFSSAHAAVERVAGGMSHRVLHEERHAPERAVGQRRRTPRPCGPCRTCGGSPR